MQKIAINENEHAKRKGASRAQDPSLPLVDQGEP